MPNVSNIAVVPRAELVSILIPCVGMAEYTKLCVPSILRCSREPFELIFLDIGSLDGTLDYLQGLHTGLAGRVRVEVLRTPTDLGIKEVCQEALALARGEFICLLNNDTVVTPGWLQGLTGLAQREEIGMAGPMSNFAPAGQLVEAVPYRVEPRHGTTNPFSATEPLVDVAAVQRFALQLTEEQKGKWRPVDRLAGFCLLLKTEVLKRIGPDLDKWSDLSLFDTDILSAKARRVGFELGVCSNIFVHHFGTRVFAHTAAKVEEALTGGR